jgi:hypothetical protein
MPPSRSGLGVGTATTEGSRSGGVRGVNTRLTGLQRSAYAFGGLWDQRISWVRVSETRG